MSNPNTPRPNTFELPGLTTTGFSLTGADIIVVGGSPTLKHPRLTLEGGNDAFTYSYTDGGLVVHENDTDPGQTRRRASLCIPKNHTGNEYSFETDSGSAFFAGEMEAQLLRIESASGGIALRCAGADTVDLRTVTGDITATNVASLHPVTMQSESGDITVDGGYAPVWDLSTNGEITTAPHTRGLVGSSPTSDEVRVG